jgi:hypothetical protein
MFIDPSRNNLSTLIIQLKNGKNHEEGDESDDNIGQPSPYHVNHGSIVASRTRTKTRTSAASYLSLNNAICRVAKQFLKYDHSQRIKLGE